MRRGISALGLVAVLAAACGGNGAAQFAGGTPTAEATYGSCVFCHHELAGTMTTTGGHHDLALKCEACHDDRTPGFVGPGHRAVPACADCHAEQNTHHDPATPCVTCHTPHGSSNLSLIREQITTPTAGVRDVILDNFLGRADGSLASVSHPGTGLCEICHTTTTFYRGDGSGDEHFPFPCFTCHPHANGFSPR